MNKAAIAKLREQLSGLKVEALLITNHINVAYLSSFAGEAHLLITPSKKFLIVDPRFKEQAEATLRSWQIWPRPAFEPLEKSLLNLAHKLSINRLGFEAASISYEFYRKLNKTLNRLKFIPTANIIEQLRMIKTTQEIRILKQAAKLSVQSFNFAKTIIQPGKKEAEVARELQYFMKKKGAQDQSFDIIVASGNRSSLPHAPVSDRIIRRNEAILVDLGCRVSGYNSDLTRMVFLGKIGDTLKRNYEIVSQAQQLAIKAVKAGIEIRQVDQVARQYIAKKGLNSLFIHALGHGIGREIHERPTISPKNHDILKAGMVFTVEPGIYIPGWGGIRVEDMVLVKKNGCEILTK